MTDRLEPGLGSIPTPIPARPPGTHVSDASTDDAPDLGGPWVGIAANPGSGRGKGRQRVEQLKAELERLGLSVCIAWTLADRARIVARSARDPDCRCLVAAGGDGTVADLVNEGPSVPITVLPAGTENLFARHFHLGRSPARLASVIAEGRVVPLDLGMAAARRFTLMAGIGFDADVVSRHHSNRVGRSGVARPTNRSAYVDSVLRSSFSYRFPPLNLSITDPGKEERIVGTTAFIFNLPRYALGLPFAPSASGDDGLLDLVVFRNAGPIQALRYLWMVVRGVHLRHESVEHRRARRIVVSSAETVPVQLDGDPGGVVAPADDSGAHWSVEVLPAALKVLVPSSY